MHPCLPRVCYMHSAPPHLTSTLCDIVPFHMAVDHSSKQISDGVALHVTQCASFAHKVVTNEHNTAEDGEGTVTQTLVAARVSCGTPLASMGTISCERTPAFSANFFVAWRTASVSSENSCASIAISLCFLAAAQMAQDTA